MFHHYMTRFTDKLGEHYISWIQFNLFNLTFTLSKREYVNGVRIGK